MTETDANMDSPEHHQDQGFTLIEILIAIVVVGILSSVALVGIAGLTNTARKGACAASADAAKTASDAYYANNNRRFPTRWSNMTTATPPIYILANGVTINGGIPTELDGKGWKLTMTGGGTTEAAFTCH
jgi:prepilin-type N-terminal cleavage/methylation domain-containing protein